MSRREARETAMRMLYKQTINKGEEEDHHSLELAKYLDEDKGILLTEKDNEYLDDILKGVEIHKDDLDQLIKTYSKGWKLSRIPFVDLSVLRLALYEIFYREDIPVSVAINESVEIAKKYCGESSAPFINGLLGQIAKNEKDKKLAENEMIENETTE